MKKLLPLLALLVLSLPAVAEEAAAPEIPGAEAPAIESMEAHRSTTVEPSAEPVLDADGLPKSAVELAIEENSAAYECPPYTTYCQMDRQCDAACGGPGTGACEFGCCYCAF